jgi:hypothetical protein
MIEGPTMKQYTMRAKPSIYVPSPRLNAAAQIFLDRRAQSHSHDDDDASRHPDVTVPLQGVRCLCFARQVLQAPSKLQTRNKAQPRTTVNIYNPSSSHVSTHQEGASILFARENSSGGGESCLERGAACLERGAAASPATYRRPCHSGYYRWRPTRKGESLACPLAIYSWASVTDLLA